MSAAPAQEKARSRAMAWVSANLLQLRGAVRPEMSETVLRRGNVGHLLASRSRCMLWPQRLRQGQPTGTPCDHYTGAARAEMVPLSWYHGP